MDKKKILIYPYDIEFCPVLRHAGILPGYTVAALVSPGGWGFTGRDAGRADRGDRLNINVSGDFDGSLDLCDTVLFTEALRPLDFEKYILPKAQMAAESGKDIIFLRSAEEKSFTLLKEICRKYNVRLTVLKDFEEEYTYRDLEFFGLQKINTPVIFVTGLYERTQKFELQLSLREALSKLGYKVSQIGSRNYCGLLGFHSFPRFMYGTSLAEEKKIMAFNHYVKELEVREEPDVFIIGIPGGIMKINDTFTGRFGILAYEASQAIAPDAAVVSTFYEAFDSDYFQKIATSLKYKLGFDVSCFNLSNVKFDWEVSRENSKESYIMLDSSFIDKKKADFISLQTPVFNTLNNIDRTGMANFLIDTLAYYGEIESV